MDLDFTDVFNRILAEPFRWTYIGKPLMGAQSSGQFRVRGTIWRLWRSRSNYAVGKRMASVLGGRDGVSAERQRSRQCL